MDRNRDNNLDTHICQREIGEAALSSELTLTDGNADGTGIGVFLSL